MDHLKNNSFGPIGSVYYNSGIQTQDFYELIDENSVERQKKNRNTPRSAKSKLEYTIFVIVCDDKQKKKIN